MTPYNGVDSKEFPKVIIKSDSQLVVNSINDKISVSKNITNLVKNIRLLFSYYVDIRIQY